MANNIDVCRTVSCAAGEPVVLTASGVGTDPSRPPTITWELMSYPVGGASSVLQPFNNNTQAQFISTIAGCYTVRVTCCYDVNIK